MILRVAPRPGSQTMRFALLPSPWWFSLKRALARCALAVSKALTGPPLDEADAKKWDEQERIFRI